MLRAQKAKSVVAILIHQFRSIIVWLLAGAAALSFTFGDLPEATAIMVVLLINGAIGFITELRAARSMESLLRIAEVRTLVRRAGKVHRIDARDLVPGDIALLHAGDIVTADLRLIEASNLNADESVLTGESVPVVKNPAPVAAGTDVEMRPAGPAAEDGRLDAGSRAAWAAPDGGGGGGVAASRTGDETGRQPDADAYSGLTLIGPVCFLDPLRADVPAAVRASLDAGVRTVMLTGDHADTAKTIARHAGLCADGLTVMRGRRGHSP